MRADIETFAESYRAAVRRLRDLARRRRGAEAKRLRALAKAIADEAKRRAIQEHEPDPIR